jgi:hypothetical protein
MSLLLRRLGAAAAARAAPVARAASAATVASASSFQSARPLPPPPPRILALETQDFPTLRAENGAYVDKTGAIADLLSSGGKAARQLRRVSFARPRKFGKSLTLSVAAEMLAAGELPAGVTPWPGYAPVDVEAVFGGLAVHERLRAGDASLGGLLRRAHFVVKLGLAGAQTGAKLEGQIYGEIARIAGAAFGDALEAKVRQASTPNEALSILVSAVPRGVPVAVLIDEYDAAIIQDVSNGRWAAAEAGVEALRSLLVTTKAFDVGPRIERCLVTGVARFSHTSLFSGANNFIDLSGSPLLSRVLGFSEAEIRAYFPDELKQVANGLRLDVDGAVAELARWYNGYCFDGTSSCFNPFPVLKALEAGAISERELEAASGVNWLGMSPANVVERLAVELKDGLASDLPLVDLSGLKGGRVRALPLLLQTGLLSIVAGHPQRCGPPNEYARRSLQSMVANALATITTSATELDVPVFFLGPALRDRNRADFMDKVTRLFELFPRTLAPRGEVACENVSASRPQGEATFHASLFGVLLASISPASGISVRSQVPVLRGVADLVIEFDSRPGFTSAVWIIELGQGKVGAPAKLWQAQQYASAFAGAAELLCCGIVVADAPPASKLKLARAAASTVLPAPSPEASPHDDVPPSRGGKLVRFAWSRHVAEPSATLGSAMVWEPLRP